MLCVLILGIAKGKARSLVSSIGFIVHNFSRKFAPSKTKCWKKQSQMYHMPRWMLAAIPKLISLGHSVSDFISAE